MRFEGLPEQGDGARQLEGRNDMIVNGSPVSLVSPSSSSECWTLFFLLLLLLAEGTEAHQHSTEIAALLIGKRDLCFGASLHRSASLGMKAVASLLGDQQRRTIVHPLASSEIKSN